jgi:DNA-binding response OmpR family regulator
MAENRILVVEDDEITAGMLSLVLEREGFDVVTAADGEEGLRLLIDDDVRLLITDCLIPKLDGFKLVKRVRAIDTLRGIPIVMMSAIYRKGNYRQAAMEAGADLYVVKPFKPEDMLDEVKKLLAGSAGRSSTE